jgi:type II secretory pathway pseudopilin PulG
MKTIRKRNAGQELDGITPRQGERGGVTLSEVLVSMLIMSVGVVSLATLFPISVLRTAQATQLTHAVFVRKNAEAAVESNLGLLSNAQISLPVLPNIVTNAVVDPMGFVEFGAGVTLGGIPRVSGGVGTQAQAQTLAALPDSWSTVFDDLVTSFGPNQITISTTPSGLSPGTGPGNATYRLIMTDVTGKFAVLKILSGVAGSTLSWTSAALPAGFTPANVRVEVQEFRYTYLLTVRKKAIPTVNNDQSWIADVDVAVFFNRFFRAASANPEKGDETPWTLTPPSGVNGGWGYDNQPGVAGVDDDGNGVTDDAPNEVGWPGSDDNRTIQIVFPAAPPYLRKGSYMLESSMLKWYRIVDFGPTYPTNITSVTTGGTATVLLDQDVRFSPTTAVLNGIFLKGLVDVFPLGSRTGQQ